MKNYIFGAPIKMVKYSRIHYQRGIYEIILKLNLGIFDPQVKFFYLQRHVYVSVSSIF